MQGNLGSSGGWRVAAAKWQRRVSPRTLRSHFQLIYTPLSQPLDVVVVQVLQAVQLRVDLSFYLLRRPQHLLLDNLLHRLHRSCPAVMLQERS